jgi:hypothetical protein
VVTLVRDDRHRLNPIQPAIFNMGSKVPIMAVFGWQLNRFERFLFGAALFLAGVLIVVRIGAILLLAILHHVR